MSTCVLYVLTALVAQVSPQIDIKPPDAVILGEPVQVIIRHVTANKEVTLEARQYDSSGRVWRSSATFVTPESGQIDLASQAPIAGSYAVADAAGMFWSMTEEKDAPSVPAASDPNASLIKFTLTIDGKQAAERAYRFWLRAPGVSSVDVTDHGLVATFFKPAGAGRRPGIIVVGGSGGGISWQRSMSGLLASHGYAALALAYFGMEGLPDDLQVIPLEYFDNAIEWMGKHPDVDSQKIAVMGVSKGGELALLLAANHKELTATVAYVPSSVVFQSIAPKWPVTSSWSRDGKGLPFVPYASSLRFRQSGKLVYLYDDSLKNTSAVENARIPVENINGPLLLISGRADTLWPSTAMCEQIVQRLESAQQRFAFRHVAYESAGHAIAKPGYAPAGRAVRLGGTVEGNARARNAAWREVLEFLKDNLRP